MKQYLVLLSFLFFSDPSSALSCGELDNIQYLAETSDFAFIGHIEEKQRDFSFTKEKYLVKVVMANKGNISSQIEIWTWNRDSCGADFQPGGDYVIFASSRKGKIITSYGWTWVISDRNEEMTQQYFDYFEIDSYKP